MVGPGRTARRALGLTLILAAAATIGGLLLAAPFWRVFTGETPDPRALALTRALMLAMAPMGCVFVQVNILLALRRFRAAAAVVPIALAYVFALYHGTARLEQVAPLAGGAALLTAVALAAAGSLAPRINRQAGVHGPVPSAT